MDLPIELQVEKELGITKEDIGKSISISDYNAHCRAAVLRYTSAWEEMTEQMGFTLDMQHPYRTCDASYIESVWWLLSEFYKKDLLYVGYSIQPYSPAAGTAISQHELNQPGCYKSVKDISITAQFKLLDREESYLLAWTTTPWTLPANSALAVGSDIVYLEVETVNRYTKKPIRVWISEDSLSRYFESEGEDTALSAYIEANNAPLPYRVLSKCRGHELEGLCYEQIMPYIKLPKPAFQVWCADFVNTEEGTGIVHIAPTFGSDDHLLAQERGIPIPLVRDDQGREVPIVDARGRFVEEISDFAGLPVKPFSEEDERQKSTDLRIAELLKKEQKAFLIAKYTHNYPHCWRTDRAILYYPIRSWFIRSSALRAQLVELNQQIEWQPPATGVGRFHNWLEQLEDWNISRSRFWGTPLPIWVSEDRKTVRCVGSFEELRREVDRAVEAGLMSERLPQDFDPHRPFVDEIVLRGPEDEPLRRVPEVIDVWFDSGAMPYAQWHYPFENEELFAQQFPADFIAEGVDQTRGWFFTLHAISGILFNKVAYRRVLSCGLILDKEGRKMSKRLGNALDPIEVLNTYGSDATRWYLMSSASPWDNVRFSIEDLATLKRTFFSTLEHTFDFLMMYAEIDGFRYDPRDVLPVSERLLIDQWLMSRLISLEREVREAYERFEPRVAARSMQKFLSEDLSNWYVRLNRKRFWQGEQNNEKRAAYETLFEALRCFVQLAAPIAPFITDFIFGALSGIEEPQRSGSVHSMPFPLSSSEPRSDLEQSMLYAQRISSLVHSIRKRKRIKVRQPLPLVLIADDAERTLEQRLGLCGMFILQEVNVKVIRFSSELPVSLRKSVRANLPKLGPKYGSEIKAIQSALQALTQEEIQSAETEGTLELQIGERAIELQATDLLIDSEEIEGWEVAKDNEITLALDLHPSPELIQEGIAREFVNKVQHLRKASGMELQDKISIALYCNEELRVALEAQSNYICQETQARTIHWADDHFSSTSLTPLVLDDYNLKISIERCSSSEEV